MTTSKFEPTCGNCKWRQNTNEHTPGNPHWHCCVQSGNDTCMTLERPLPCQHWLHQDAPWPFTTIPKGDKKKTESSVIEEVVQAWNDMAVGAGRPAIKTVTGARRKALCARLKEPNGLASVLEAIAWVGRSSFLQGTIDGRTWSGATFDWILKPANFVKILEGNYADRTRPSDEHRRTMFQGPLPLVEDGEDDGTDLIPY